MIDIDLTIESGDWPEEAVLGSLCEGVIAAATDEIGLASADSEISVIFTSDAGIRELNGKWRGKDKATNVLSFPAFPPRSDGSLPPLLGDIVLAADTVRSEAAEEGKPLENHISHLLVHGFLHLLGYDHETDAEAEKMEALERRILARLAIPDPYA